MMDRRPGLRAASSYRTGPPDRKRRGRKPLGTFVAPRTGPQNRHDCATPHAALRGGSLRVSKLARGARSTGPWSVDTFS